MIFEEQWPLMRPTILKLLRQEPVSRAEWHELFWSVHMVCLWDEKSHAKMYKALQDDILEFIKQAQTVSYIVLHCSCSCLKCLSSNFREYLLMKRTSHCWGLTSVNGANFLPSAHICLCLSSNLKQLFRVRHIALYKRSLNKTQMTV